MRCIRQVFPALLLIVCLPSCTYYAGPNLLIRHYKAEPLTIPAVYDYSSSYSAAMDYDIHHPLVKHYADMPIPTKAEVPKKDVTRILIAKLVQGREVPEVNAFLMTLTPWSGHGTTSGLHPSGDYDFTEITMCTLLYLLGDKPAILYPATRDHVVNTLIEYHGSKQALRMPGFLGIMRETENHILMGEVSRYLKNQWLHEHGDTNPDNDNLKNGIEKWMIKHLDEKFRGGFYEFNSDPYSGFSMQALLTLFSFTHSDTVRHAAGKLINELMYEYSLSSINQARYPPFRRQTHRAGRTEFDSDPLSSVVRVLTSRRQGISCDVAARSHAFMCLLLRYRLNDALASLLTTKGEPYFALLGHGRKGAPEIYTGGKGYVLSAGGMQRGAASQLAARPTMLLLNDHVTHRDSCFYVCGKGKMPHWNNSGLYQNFACSDQPVHIPPQYSPALQKDGWQVFHDAHGLSIITYSSNNLGLLMVADSCEADDSKILDSLIKANAGLSLKKQFMLPGRSKVSYDLHSPKNRWVISSVDGKKVNRAFDKWPRMNVSY